MDEIPVSYEVARKKLDEAQTRQELDDAIREASRAFVREKILPYIEDGGKDGDC